MIATVVEQVRFPPKFLTPISSITSFATAANHSHHNQIHRYLYVLRTTTKFETSLQSRTKRKLTLNIAIIILLSAPDFNMGEHDTKRSLETTAATTRGGTKLLLHCVDGCVPYLNPNQLEQHFPPSDLWLGLAVRDCCVAPIFNVPRPSEPKGPGKRKGKPKKQSDTPKNKVRGYTFAATSPDPWLLPYTRITVPSFDLQNTDPCDNKKGGKSAVAYGNTSKNTNNSIHVWTPHGRQKLTADLYATASLEGLQSQHTVSLFDDVDEEEFSSRRKQKAESRNKQWFQKLSSRCKSLLSKETSTNDSNDGKQANGSCDRISSLWKPILLPHQAEKDLDLNEKASSNPSTSSQNEDAKEGNSEEHVPSGVAFVGRWRPGLELSQMIRKDLASGSKLDSIQWKAILTTHSFSEFLDIAGTGIVNVIGTNLPQKWAKEKLALGIDLSMIPLPAAPRDPKRQKTDTEESIIPNTVAEATVESTDKMILNANGCMDCSDVRFARDPGPLVAGCGCFVCKENRFSRAYIHHLVVAKEMLADVLIFGHNLHCLIQLLRCFDDSVESDRTKLKDFFLRQLQS